MNLGQQPTYPATGSLSGASSVSFSVSVRKKAVKRKAIPKLTTEDKTQETPRGAASRDNEVDPDSSVGSKVAPSKDPEPTKPQVPPDAQLFVFGIPTSWNREELLAMFSEYGNVVEATIGVEKSTGRSRGFGFVDFSEPSEASKAMKEADAKWIEGKRLKVTLRGDQGKESKQQAAKRKKVSVLHR
eukprot:CAMPEP_0197865468 /NCGR_PEP_ID=MMETSP1438-20131217/43686_1 /TAXON_ID=1461541 /ORGANISM="Pterosperma sp., Strain CCMP1384" /LENGTH=185 /DNA_ID=CAMNT_0043483945 /DNA_START=369 /DNA_END=927 /DNA_ORIENTATION=-